MSHAEVGVGRRPLDETPPELRALMERVRSLPESVRSELEPIVGDAMEQAVYRSRVLSLAREALERFRLDLEVTRFDLEATRRERERFRQLLDFDE